MNGIGLGICLGDDEQLASVEDILTLAEKHATKYYIGIPGTHGWLSTNSESEFLQHFPQALDAAPEGHPDRLSLISTLCRVRDEGANDIKCYFPDNRVEQVLGLVRESIWATPDDSPELPARLNTLSSLLQLRYVKSKAVSDWNEAIDADQRAFNATPRDHVKWAIRLNDICEAMYEKSRLTRDAADLNAALEKGFEAVDLVPDNHPNKDEVLWKLGQFLNSNRPIEAADSERKFDEAMEILWRAHSATRKEEASERRRADIVNYFRREYLRTGDIRRLDTSIKTMKDGLNGEEYSPCSNYELGTMFIYRYLRTGAMADLDESIVEMETAIHSTSKDSRRTEWHNRLAQGYGYRYLVTRAESDVNNAIYILREAVNDNSLRQQSKYDFDPGSQIRDESSLALASQLGSRFRRTGRIRDLDEAIEIERRVISNPNGGTYDKQLVLSTHGTRLLERYHKTKNPDDLESADKVCRQAVEKWKWNNRDGSGHQDVLDSDSWSIAYCALGEVCRQKYAVAGASSSDMMVQAVSNFGAALRQDSGTPQDRIRAGIKLLESLALLCLWEEACEAAGMTLALLRKVISRSLENPEKQHILAQSTGFANDAAAVALNAKRSAAVALNFLEQGRGVLATSLEEMRADISELQTKHPDLAARFVRLRNQLEVSATRRDDSRAPGTGVNSNSVYRTGQKDDDSRRGRGGNSNSIPRAGGTDDDEDARTPDDDYDSDTTIKDEKSPATAEPRSMERHRLGVELDELVLEIRQKPGFHDFLMAPSLDELQSAARNGPIAVINVSRYRCDAILVETHGVRSLPLPRLRRRDIRDKARAAAGRNNTTEVLEWLWDTVTGPVLDALGFTHAHAQSGNAPWAHVWWVATGALSTFPLHAAGYHERTDSGETVLDRVMSSYTSSIKAMIHNQRHGMSVLSPSASAPGQALLVGMQQTPGCSPLWSATKEISLLQNMFTQRGGGAWTVHTPPAKKQHVISYMSMCQVFHFAGHSSSDRTNPARSFLHLQDWQTTRLAIADLLDLDFRRRGHQPFLSYLSACGTGQAWGEEFIDESIHIISAFQLAGFRRAIGTLWEVHDDLCVDVAATAYEVMLRGEVGMTDRSVCLGLHVATRRLRDQWRGSRLSDASGEAAARGEGLRDRQLNPGRDVRQNRDIEGCEEHLLHWVPFVHYGV